MKIPMKMHSAEEREKVCKFMFVADEDDDLKSKEEAMEIYKIENGIKIPRFLSWNFKMKTLIKSFPILT